MTRREEDGLFDLIAELPWWIGVIISAVIYVVMRYALPAALESGDAMLGAFAGVSRMFALPLAALGLFASAISAIRTAAARRRANAEPGQGVARSCPRCGGQLVVRQASRGSRAGSRFWGCSNFPSCRHTEEISS